MSRFHFTQVTDRWSPAPQLKILNGMSIALPPELCMPLVGAISDGVADIDFMLRIGMFGHFTASGIFPTMAERHSAARERWKHAIDLYKRFMRPMLSSSRLYHHTPVQRQTEEGEWVVLECVCHDACQGYAGIFRLGGAAEDTYRFHPRGLDTSRRYRMTYDTSGLTHEVAGSSIVDNGLPIRVPSPCRSELILFEET
jgi:hypothetical protein